MVEAISYAYYAGFASKSALHDYIKMRYIYYIILINDFKNKFICELFFCFALHKIKNS